jgi:L-fuculose-phosphate aldolase
MAPFYTSSEGHTSHEPQTSDGEFAGLSPQQKITEVCQRLHARNLLAAADGNVSMRISDDEILITPTGVAKAFMKSTAMAVINLNGEIIHGEPSGERHMHLEIYRKCPQAKAVIHAHPPTAIAWSLVQPGLDELPTSALPEVILAAGEIPIVPYARPGSAQMGTHLHPYLPGCRAMILARHGAVTWGESIEEAYRGMERIEHVSLILAQAKALGTLAPLPDEELKALKILRSQLGDKLL